MEVQLRKITEYDNVASVTEGLIFGVLFCFEIIYILWLLVNFGWSEFFRYWSCWNYFANASFYFLVLIGRKGGARTLAFFLTPYMLGLNALWASLSIVIAVWGAVDMSPDETTSNQAKYDVDNIERLLGMGFLHFGPVIATTLYFVLNLTLIRAAFGGVADSACAHIRTCPKLCATGFVFWLPWLGFLVYTLTFNPYEVYGFVKPSPDTMLFAEVCGCAIYTTVMNIVLMCIFLPCKCCAVRKDGKAV